MSLALACLPNANELDQCCFGSHFGAVDESLVWSMLCIRFLAISPRRLGGSDLDHADSHARFMNHPTPQQVNRPELDEQGLLCEQDTSPASFRAAALGLFTVQCFCDGTTRRTLLAPSETPASLAILGCLLVSDRGPGGLSTEDRHRIRN